MTVQGFEDWETQEQVDACMAAHDVSADQVVRWRGEGLLPNVKQDHPRPFHGSAVLYPPRTCAQIAAAARLFKEKYRVDYVGRMLWWEGYEVDERHWRPDLIRLARWIDRVLAIMRWLARREADGSKTVPERMAQASVSNLVLSRVRRRLDMMELSDLFGSLCDVAIGQFEGFSTYETDDDGRDVVIDEAAAVKAFDLGASQIHQTTDQKFGFVKALPGTLRDISHAIAGSSFVEIAQTSGRELLDARDDARNAFRIARAMYEATEWIYGQQAFGLRLMAWIAKKAEPKFVGMHILVWVAIRRTSDGYLLSPEIAALADQAEDIQRKSQQIKRLGTDDPRFTKVLVPKRLRQGLTDRASMSLLLREIAAARENHT
jgi:hypothetical protein